MRAKTQVNPKPKRSWASRSGFGVRRGLTYLAALVVGLSATATSQAQVGPGGIAFFGDRVIKESIASTAPITQITGGTNFTFARRADGTAVSWGLNQNHQCDLPKGLTGITQVATGSLHTLILLSNGTVKAMGLNNYGQVDVPAGLSNVIQVAAGQYNSVALRSDGTVQVWGWLAAGLAPPVGLTGVVQIAAGEAHIVALKSDGSVVCWGQNTHGECNFPGGPNNVISISACYEHSGAVRSDGTITFWGANSYGESAVPAGLSSIQKIAVGPNHSLALKADGTVVGWGSNYAGERVPPAGLTNVKSLGAGSQASYAIDGTGKVIAWGNSDFGQTLVPSALYDIRKIAAGFGHVVMLKHDGSIAAWGRNSELQCDVSGLLTSGYSDVSAGTMHSALTGASFANKNLFGDNSWLQIAIPPNMGSVYDHYWAVGSTTYAHKIAGGVDGYGRSIEGELGLVSQGDFVQIAGGALHAVGLRPNGTVATAGSNSNGQLNVPAGLANITQVSAGTFHSLALGSNGLITGWGLNNAGQCTAPGNLLSPIQIGGGHEHSVALQASGTVAAWGGNSYGQLSGLDGLGGISQIGVGEYFTACLPNVSLSVAPYSVYGGKTATGTVFIPTPAPASGVSVLLTSSSSYASVPSAVVIPSGATSTTFAITTTNPDVVTQPVITALVKDVPQSALLTIKPTDFTMVTSIPSVVGGSTMPLTLSVVLAHPAPAGGATINVVSSDPSITVPSPIIIQSGQQSKQVALSDLRVHTATPVTITGSYANTVAVNSITVNPFQVTFMGLNPSTIVSGFPTTVSVTLNSVAANPVTVQLTSNNSAVIASPQTITVAANNNVGTLTVTPGVITTAVGMKLTASLDGSSVLRDFVVIPAVALATNVTSVIGGSTNPTTLTVTIPLPAPVGGASITLSSTDPSITFTNPLVIPSGQTTKTITLPVGRVHALTHLTISAAYSTSVAQIGFMVLPLQVTVFNVAPVPVIGGGSTTGTVTLNATPTSDVVVSLISWNNTVVPGPVSLKVLANSNQGSAKIVTAPVATNTSVTVAANLDGSAVNNVFTVNAALSKVALSSSSAYGATNLTATITLTMPAPVGGLTVKLACVNGQLLTPNWVIGAGQTTSTFPVATNDLAANATLSLTATLGPQSVSTTATVMPNRITTFVVNPTRYIGNSTTKVTATVTLMAPVVYDVYVNGTSTNSALAGLPGLITIPAGKVSAAVVVTHSKATKSTAVTVTATRAGASKAVNVTVQ